LRPDCEPPSLKNRDSNITVPKAPRSGTGPGDPGTGPGAPGTGPGVPEAGPGDPGAGQRMPNNRTSGTLNWAKGGSLIAP
jgi:hypothetical protein